jgi:putative ABC transport system permease protein
MSLWSRCANVFRGDRLDRDIDEELQSHIEEAIAEGRDPEEARRAFGSTLRVREDSRDVKVAVWLDWLWADIAFGWRQLLKNRITAGAAILSLALAIGACTSAFRLIDAVLLRPLPITDPDRMYVITHQYTDDRNAKVDRDDSFEYPLYRQLRETAKDQAELIAISYSGRIDLTYGSDLEMEKAYRQYVSGSMFNSFGLTPVAGRLLTPNDDVKPGAHPYAVISYDYWTRRFGRDPKVVGRTFRAGNDVVEIVGVCREGFTGTETGTLTDIFVPTMMNAKAIGDSGWSWFRTWLRLKPGASLEQVRQKLQAGISEFRREQVKKWPANAPKQRIAEYVDAPIFLETATAGFSGMQKNYRRSLAILGVIVALVLLIACANVANLMTAQGASRAREMALRVSIGAGQWRLFQLVLVESVLLALAASVLGALFAWWSAPLVVSMINPPDNPARLILPADWRVLTFIVVLAISVTGLFGIVPALRASTVRPMSALKGGEDPHARRRLMHTLIAAQVAFCFVVHFVAGLFVATFEGLSNQPTGFAVERVLAVDTVAKGENPVAYWEQVMQRLKAVNGVESAAVCGWPLLSGNGWSGDIWLNGRAPENDNPYFLSVSPGWMDTMRIPLIGGRDFVSKDMHPAAAIVNEAFAKRYFDGQNPLGKSFETNTQKGRVRIQIIGYVRDARYKNMREPIRPTVYVPFNSLDDKGGLRGKDRGTFVVRTAGDNPAALASILRQEVSSARSEFRVSNIRTQKELVQQHTVRERLLAMLSLFFAVVALVLAAVGLYGVLNYSVVQRQREIGIRMALGAKTSDVALRVTSQVFGMLALGALLGLIAGIGSERYIQTLLYGVKATDLTMLVLPALTIFSAALLAALPPVIHAVRIDPAVTLRAE